MKYLAYTIPFLPYTAFACITPDSDSTFVNVTDVMVASLIFMIPLTLIFYIAVRVMPRFKVKGIEWALIRTLLFFIAGVVILIPYLILQLRYATPF